MVGPHYEHEYEEVVEAYRGAVDRFNFALLRVCVCLFLANPVPRLTQLKSEIRAALKAKDKSRIAVLREQEFQAARHAVEVGGRCPSTLSLRLGTFYLTR